MRAVQVSRPYAPPPPPPGIDPDGCATFEEWRDAVVAGARHAASQGTKARGTVAEGIVRGFRALSPALAAQLCEAARLGDGGALPAELDEPSWRRLHEQWSAWLQCLRSGELACTSSPSGGYSLVGGAGEAQASVLEYMEHYYSTFQQGSEFDRVRLPTQWAWGPYELYFVARLNSCHHPCLCR